MEISEYLWSKIDLSIKYLSIAQLFILKMNFRNEEQISSVIAEINNKANVHSNSSFTGIKVQWLHKKDDFVFNNFAAYVLSRPADAEPADMPSEAMLNPSDNLVVYIYNKLKKSYSEAVVVGVGTGQTGDSWFSFELKRDTNPNYLYVEKYIDQLLKRNNNNNEIGDPGTWSWYMEHQASGRRHRNDNVSRTCTQITNGSISWEPWTLHQKSGMRLFVKPCANNTLNSISIVCALDIFGTAKWTSAIDLACNSTPINFDGGDEPSSADMDIYWEDPQVAAQGLQNETSSIDRENPDKGKLTKIAKVMNHYLKSEDTLTVKRDVAENLADVIGTITSVDSTKDQTLFAEAGKIYLESAELLGVKVHLTGNSPFLYDTEQFKMNVNRVSSRARRNAELGTECVGINARLVRDLTEDLNYSFIF